MMAPRPTHTASQPDADLLAREVWGIGFTTADKIAQVVSIAANDPARLQAGVLHALSAADGQIQVGAS
jgi:ATP-dependent exoDNAse (exonuclease V) alpha subunit